MILCRDHKRLCKELLALDQHNWAGVVMSRYEDIICRSDQEYAREHDDSPIPRSLSVHTQDHELGDTHMFCGVAGFVKGQTKKNRMGMTNRIATTLIARPYLPSDQRLGGRGSPYKRRQMTHPIVRK